MMGEHDTSRTCPVNGCAQSRTPGTLLCDFHWGLLPDVTRERVRKTGAASDVSAWLVTATDAVRQARELDTLGGAMGPGAAGF